MNLKKFKAFIALTRWTEIYDYALVLSMLGMLMAGQGWNWRIIPVYLATILGQCFAFMINDVEDAEDDATNPKKLKRNPVSHGALSKKEGYFYSALVAVLTILAFAVLAISNQNWPLMVLISSLIIIVMFLYSWKPVRLKSMPVFDALSHVFMLAGGPFLVAYLSFKPVLDDPAWLGFAFVTVVSFYGVLDNQVRDYETDRKTNIKNSASFMGFTFSKILQYVFLLAATVLVIIYINSLPQGFLILGKGAALLAAASAYPLVKFLIKRDRAQLKVDMHKALLFSGYALIILKILNVI